MRRRRTDSNTAVGAVADAAWVRLLWPLRGWRSERRRSLPRTVPKLAVFVAASVLLTTIVVASLLNLDTTASTTYQAVFSDASTIQPGNPVMVAGVEVGRVGAVRLDGTRAVVSLAVDRPYHATSRTRAAVDFQNLFGDRFVELSGTTTGRPLPPGGTIPANRTTPALDLTALFDGFQPLYQALTPSQVNQLTANIVSAFQGESGSVASLVQQTAQLTTNLADRGQVIDSVVTNLSALANLVASHHAQLAQLIDNFDALATGLGGERQLINSSLASAASATGDLSSLVGAVQPSFEQSVTGLAAFTGTLQRDQGTLDSLIAALPPFVTALDRVGNSGGFFKIYLCEDYVYSDTGPGLYLGPVNSLLGVPLTDVPLLYLAIKTGPLGGTPALDTHTRNCSS